MTLSEIEKKMKSNRVQIYRIRRSPKNRTLKSLLRYARAVGKSDAELYAELLRTGANKINW